MCYRFAYGDVEKSLKKYNLKLRDEAIDRLKDPFSVFPGDYAPIVYKEEEAGGILIADTFKWGLLPFWAKDEKLGKKLFNARSETISQKPSFKTSFNKMRCIVPVVGFYETWREGKNKKPYYFYLKDEEPFSLAGLYNVWHDIPTFTVITMPSNVTIQSIHDRMPLVLNSETEKLWLDKGNDSAILRSLTSTDNSINLIKLLKAN